MTVTTSHGAPYPQLSSPPGKEMQHELTKSFNSQCIIPTSRFLWTCVRLYSPTEDQGQNLDFISFKGIHLVRAQEKI